MFEKIKIFFNQIFTQRRTVDMTVGSPLKLILFFAIPMFVGNIFQQLYNIFDTMVAGYALGDDIIAAISSTTQFSFLIIGFANGMNSGFGMMIARAFGNKDPYKVKHTVAMALLLNIVSTVIFTTLAVSLMRRMLVFLNTPADIFQDAYAYAIIIVAGLCTNLFFNMGSGMMNAVGNSTKPLLFLIISCFINISLDVLFVVVLPFFGVSGLALATVIAQGVSAVMCFVHVWKKYPELVPDKEHFRIDWKYLLDMFATGLSMGFTGSIYAIGSVAMQGSINNLGKTFITANADARKLLSLGMQPLSTSATATATFASQNYGAGKYDRVTKGFRDVILVGFAWTAVTTVFIYLCAPFMVRIMTGTDNLEIISNAHLFLKLNYPFYLALGPLFVLRMGLQAIGSRVMPVISSMIELFGKLVSAFWFVPTFGFVAVCLTEPVLWLACAIWLAIAYLIYRRRLKQRMHQAQSAV